MNVAIPRPSYPRPQFYRDRWLNLNGTWEFEFDNSDTGLERGLLTRPLAREIVVPFAPESEASGIADTDFHEAVWYRRHVDIPADWENDAVLLHFQAVDHDSTVWVNGVEVGRHRGGFTTFTFDITDALDGRSSAEIVVRARDSRHGVQARGKQATWFENTHAHYTRTTGIWQTVWMEPVPTVAMRRPRILPREAPRGFEVTVPLSRSVIGWGLEVELLEDGEVVAWTSTATGSTLSPSVVVSIPAGRERWWTPESPFLYGIRLTLRNPDGEIVDYAESYAGLRFIAIEGRRLLLNGEPVFQRLVLDQGYWPQSLMTAPDDEALERDIHLALDAGFNGARVHEKIAEELYLYHADRLGFLVWGEFGDWGASGQGVEGNNQQPTSSYITQWTEALERDISHPSIVGWCPLNETYQLLHDRITDLDDVTHGMFRTTKLIDPTRPVIDASGYSHRVPETDIWDSHDYEQEPSAFAANHAGLSKDLPFQNTLPDGRPYSTPYQGQPYFVSEFGGIWWAREIPGSDGEDREQSWGYGQRVRDEAEFYARFEGLVRVLDGNPDMFGYCYTQLTDVFQEQNGLYAFDRSLKLDIKQLRAAQSNRPAYEVEKLDTGHSHRQPSARTAARLENS
jgi:beta-galactosidase/beta-glucuronidase